MWRLLNAFQLLFVLLWSAGWISLALLVRVVTRRSRGPLWMARSLWAPGVLAAAGVRLETSGVDRLEPHTPYLFVANHQSLLDIPVLFRVLPAPLRFVAKEPLRRVPFLGWYIQAMGMIFVPTGGRLQAATAVDDVRTRLAEGASVATFPEGTRSRDGRVARFKSGALAPAIDCGVPVVPVAIDGSGVVLPRDGFRSRPGRIIVTVGEPVSTEGLETRDRSDVTLSVRQRILRLLGAPSH